MGRARGSVACMTCSLWESGAAIAIAFATSGLWAKRQEVLSQQTAAQGDVLADIGNSINGIYLATYYSNLVNGTAIAGVANAYAPTMTELENINVVPSGYSTTSAYGTPYVISLAKTPAGCVAPRCDIAGLVYIAGAITDPSTGRPMTLDDGAAAIGGDGGYSDIITPSTITGVNAAWNQPNPLGSVSGVLAMRVGYGSSGWSAFVRRDGSLPMEGDLNFRGTTGALHNIVNAATVSASAYVSANGAWSTTIANDGLGNTNTYQAGAWQFLNQTGTAWAPVNSGNVNSNGSVAATGNVTANGRLTSNEYIQPNGFASVEQVAPQWFDRQFGRWPTVLSIRCVDRDRPRRNRAESIRAAGQLDDGFRRPHLLRDGKSCGVLVGSDLRGFLRRHECKRLSAVPLGWAKRK